MSCELCSSPMCGAGAIRNSVCGPPVEFKSDLKELLKKYSKALTDEAYEELTTAILNSPTITCPYIHEAFEKTASLYKETRDLEVAKANQDLSKILHGSYLPDKEKYWNSLNESWQKERPNSIQDVPSGEQCVEIFKKYKFELPKNCKKFVFKKSKNRQNGPKKKR